MNRYIFKVKLHQPNMFLTIVLLLILEFFNSLLRAYNLINIQFSIFIREIIFIALVIFLAFLFLKQKIIRHNILNFVFLYIYMMIISLLSGINNITEISNLIMPLVLGMLGTYINYDINHNLYRNFIKISALLLMLMYVSQVLYGKYGHDPAGINSIYYLIVLFPLILDLPNTLSRNIIVILVILVTIVSLKSTALVIILVVLIIEYFYRIENKSFKFIIMPFTFIFLIGVVMIISKNILNIDIYNLYVRANILDGGNGRTEIWANVIELYNTCSTSGKVFGNGFNMVAKLTNLSAHNDFLEMLYDFGLVGLFGIVYYIFFFLKNIVKQNSKLNKVLLMMISELIIFFTFSSCLFQASYCLLIIFIIFCIISSKEKAIRSK